MSIVRKAGTTDVSVRRCKTCGAEKPLTEYYRQAGCKLGRLPNCKTCKNSKTAAWQRTNADKVNRKNAAWRASNPESAAAIQAAYRATNREKLRAAGREYVRKNADALRAARGVWSEGQRARDRANKAAWMRAHPEHRTEQEHRRRARKQGTVVGMVSRLTVWARDGGVCHICRKACDPNDWHLEHVVALANGGAHSMENVAVAHPVCNFRKGVRA